MDEMQNGIPGEWLYAHKLKVLPNVHGSAHAAYIAWIAGSLCGNALKRGPNRIHVYGIYLRDWSKVYVDFQANRILVIKPPKQGVLL